MRLHAQNRNYIMNDSYQDVFCWAFKQTMGELCENMQAVSLACIIQLTRACMMVEYVTHVHVPVIRRAEEDVTCH